MWHGYFGGENLNLSPSQKQTLAEGLRQLGPASHPQPACLCHWRRRLDDEACIYEALFDEAALTVAAFKQRLAAIFGVDPTNIGSSTVQQSFASGVTPVVTFSYNAVNYLRVALFGGVGAGWTESGDECRGYLSLYREAWEGAA